MNRQRAVLLDGGADAFSECGLSRGYGDAAVGDVAGRVNELAGREGLEQRVQVRLGLKIERRLRAPEAVEHKFRIFRRAEASHERGCLVESFVVSVGDAAGDGAGNGK